jgi:glutamyl-tRNA reductase
VTRELPIWAVVAAADRFAMGDRERIATRAREHVADRRDCLALVTCHRVELYGTGTDEDARRALEATRIPSGPNAGPPVLLTQEEAIRHVCRLAAGLESAILGEDQVLHQLRVALSGLVERRADPGLTRLLELAVGAGRRARADVPAADRNLGEVAARWLEGHAGPLRGTSVVVAGAGPMGRLAARAVARRGADVTIATRSVSNGSGVASRIGGRVVDLAEGAAIAESVQAVIVALGGPWSAFEATGASPPTVDLSYPLAIGSLARARLGDRFADVDRIFNEAATLEGTASGSRAYRVAAEAAANQAVAAYASWSAGRRSVATLRALRERSESRRATELEHLLRRLPELDDRERELVTAFSERLVSGLLHSPSVALREDRDGSAAAAAERLFGL